MQRPGPVGGARDLNRRQTQDRLLAAALRLFLAHGTEAVTIDQLVAAAKIAKGSFYRYARDKDHLVELLMRPVGDEVVAALDRCERALARADGATLARIYLALAGELSRVVATHAERVLLFLQEARAPATSSRHTIHAIAGELRARAIALTAIARGHGLIRDVDARVSALVVLGATETLLFEHLRHGPGASAAVPATVAELVGIVLGGIRPRA